MFMVAPTLFQSHLDLSLRTTYQASMREFAQKLQTLMRSCLICGCIRLGRLNDLPGHENNMNDISITVKRTAVWSLGPMIWYVIQDDEDNRYQRISLAMDPTDECLLLTKVGDVLNITYTDKPIGLNVSQRIIQRADFA